MAGQYLQNLKETREIYMENFVLQPDMKVLKDGKFIIQSAKKAIIPATYANIQSELDTLYNKRRRLYLDYRILEDSIIMAENPQQFKKAYEDILTELSICQQNIDDLHDYYEKANDIASAKYNAMQFELEKKTEQAQNLAKI